MANVNIVYHEVTIPLCGHKIEVDLFRPPRFWLSALPAQTFDVVVLQEYVAFMKCQPCHSRLVPLGAKKLSRVSLFTPCARSRILKSEACKNVRPELEQINSSTPSNLAAWSCAGFLPYHTTLCQKTSNTSDNQCVAARDPRCIACYFLKWLSLPAPRALETLRCYDCCEM